MANSTPTPGDYGFARMALQQSTEALEALLTHWQGRGLPDDFLQGETYPFGESLDEVVASLHQAVATLRER